MNDPSTIRGRVIQLRRGRLLFASAICIIALMTAGHTHGQSVGGAVAAAAGGQAGSAVAHRVVANRAVEAFHRSNFAWFKANGFSEVILAYDEAGVSPSGRPSSVLDTTIGSGAGAPRGNVTKKQARVSATKYVTTRTEYYDTGNVRLETDARGATTTRSLDFSPRECREFAAPGSATPATTRYLAGVRVH